MNDPELAPELLARLSSREREQHVNAEFFSNLLDQRLYYANSLAPLARHTYMATGIDAGFQYVPHELMDYLPAGNLMGTLSLGFETDIDEAFSLTRFAIDLDDGPQVELKTDWLSTSVLVNGENVAMYLDPDIIDSVLRCLLPAGAPAIGPTALAYALYTQGQYQSHAMKVGNQDARFGFTSEETADDSRQLLEIDVSLPEHASGKTIMLRASIVEGLLQATNNLMSRGALDISAVPALQADDAQLYVEQVIDQRTVRVDRLTEVHRSIITTALQDFERMANKLRRSNPPKS